MNTKIFELIDKLLPVRTWALAVKVFFKHLALLPQAQDRENIENMKQYLSAVSDVIEDLKKAGAGKKEIHQIAVELYLPVVKATMDALIIRQKLEAGVKGDIQEKA